MVFCRTEQTENDEWVEDHEQTTTLKANYVISAFGSGLYDRKSKINQNNRLIYLLIPAFISHIQLLTHYPQSHWTNGTCPKSICAPIKQSFRKFSAVVIWPVQRIPPSNQWMMAKQLHGLFIATYRFVFHLRIEAGKSLIWSLIWVL